MTRSRTHPPAAIEGNMLAPLAPYLLWSLSALGAISLSPTTADFLIASLIRASLPLGTYAFYGFIALTAVLAVTGFAARRGIAITAALFAVCSYVAMTSLWSPSTIYLAVKLPLVLLLPSVLFLAGYILAATGSAVRFAHSIFVFGLAVLLSIWIFGIDQIAGFQTGLEEDFGGRYQSISRVLAIGAVVAGVIAFTSRDLRIRVALFSVAALLLLQILYTGGRVGLLIIVISAPLLLASLLRGAQLVGYVTTCVVAVILFNYVIDLFAVVQFVWPGEVPLTIQRVLLEFGEDTSSQFQLLERSNLWRLAVELWQENPLLGVGLAGYPVAAGIGDVTGVYPHNLVLELASETGLIGLMLFGAFFLYVVLGEVRADASRAEHMLAVGILACGIAISSVISDFSLQRELFIGLGLYAGLRRSTPQH